MAADGSSMRKVTSQPAAVCEGLPLVSARARSSDLGAGLIRDDAEVFPPWSERRLLITVNKSRGDFFRHGHVRLSRPGAPRRGRCERRRLRKHPDGLRHLRPPVSPLCPPARRGDCPLGPVSAHRPLYAIFLLLLPLRASARLTAIVPPSRQSKAKARPGNIYLSLINQVGGAVSARGLCSSGPAADEFITDISIDLLLLR